MARIEAKRFGLAGPRGGLYLSEKRRGFARSRSRSSLGEEVQTQENLRERIPQAPLPNRPHVLGVRPLVSLSVGSCYALRANGAWGLFKVHLPG